MRRVPFLLSLVVLLGGCATASGLRPGTGTTLVVDGRSYDQVWNAATKAVLQRLTTIMESDKAAGRLTAEQKAGAFTWGEVVGVFIRPANVPSPRYTVEVVSQKRMRPQISGQDWAGMIGEAIKIELGL